MGRSRPAVCVAVLRTAAAVRTTEASAAARSERCCNPRIGSPQCLTFTLAPDRARLSSVQLGRYTATIDFDRVQIFRDGTLIGTGRWTGRRIEERPSGISPDAPDEEDKIFAALEVGLVEEAEREVAVAQAQAYDADGVDRSLIRWMLSLTPRERLRVLDDHNRSLSRLLDARVRE